MLPVAAVVFREVRVSTLLVVILEVLLTLRVVKLESPVTVIETWLAVAALRVITLEILDIIEDVLIETILASPDTYTLPLIVTVKGGMAVEE